MPSFNLPSSDTHVVVTTCLVVLNVGGEQRNRNWTCRRQRRRQHPLYRPSNCRGKCVHAYVYMTVQLRLPRSDSVRRHLYLLFAQGFGHCRQVSASGSVQSMHEGCKGCGSLDLCLSRSASFENKDAKVLASSRETACKHGKDSCHAA